MSNEAAALITLLRNGTRPWREYRDLIEDEGSALAILQTESLLAPETSAAEADIRAWVDQGIRPLTVLDPEYPQNLRGVHDRPPLVFIRGQLNVGDARSIAVIGGRKPTPSGLKQAVTIATELTRSGFTVISGLAAGIDTTVHEAVLSHRGRTLAVIGTGVNQAYPRQNAPLQQEIGQRGAVLSQFWPDDPPTRRAFPERNATMSGLALGTVIVEASERSGTRTQARHALAHGRPVFLLESLVAQQQWARDLAQTPGTYVVGGAAEVSAAVERLSSPDILAA